MNDKLKFVLDAPSGKSIALIPGQWVTIFAVPLPRVKLNEKKALMAFAIEELIAGDIETVHCVLGAPQQNGKHTVAVIDQKIWRECKEQTTQQSGKVIAMLPDFLVLPWVENTWTIAMENNGVRLRYNRQQGFTTTVAQFEALFLLLLADETIIKPRTMVCFHQSRLTEKTLALFSDFSLECYPIERMQLNETLTQPAFNFLPSTVRWRMPTVLFDRHWRWVIYAFSVCVLSLCLALGSQIWYWHHQVQQIAQQASKIYAAMGIKLNTLTVANVQRIEKIRDNLFGEYQKNHFLRLLSKVAPVIIKGGITLQSIKYTESKLVLDFVAPNQAAGNKFVADLKQLQLSVSAVQTIMPSHNTSVRMEVTIA